MYNPNPFDFVPFAESPLLNTEAEFNVMGNLYTGYLEVRLKALTPVHIVGYQEPDGNGRKSYIYQQNEQACIPAASIRGCLRSFIESLTAGWVSQATQEYKKIFKKRHVGFSTFDWYQNKSKNRNYKKEPAVDLSYKPIANTDKNSKMDVASYLFGMVVEKDSAKISHDALAHKSRIWIEDACIEQSQLEVGQYWIPDISGEAFMGGAKPSASNWWYMQPKEIWQRNVNFKGEIKPTAEFIGDKYWGRKFYYHQNPETCIRYYSPDSNGKPRWIYRGENPFCKVKLECLKTDHFTNTFRIYVDRVPRKLLVLLVLSLFPGKNIRHKLGYGKAYGYGSIEFEIQGARLRMENNSRAEDDSQQIPLPLQDGLSDVKRWQALAWDDKKMDAEGLDATLIDRKALTKLAQILGRENSETLIFTYPPFDKGYFARGISKRDFNEAVKPDFRLEEPIKISSAETARRIATKLVEIKKPIHFQIYQENSKGWDVITKRIP